MLRLVGWRGWLVGRNGVKIFDIGITSRTPRRNVSHVIIYIRQNLQRGRLDVEMGSRSTSRKLIEGNEVAGKGDE